MSIQILEAAAHENLIPLAVVKARLGVEGTESDDILAGFIREASGEIGSFCDRHFARQRYRELLPGMGDHELMLSNAPLEDLAAVTVTVDEAAVTDFTVRGTDPPILYRATGWEWSARWGGVLDTIQHAGTEEETIQVDHHAGYILPGTGLYVPNSGDLPTPVRQLTVAAPGAAAGATSFDLEAAAVTGSIYPGWCLRVDGSELVYTVGAELAADSNQLTGVAFTPALDVAAPTGTVVTLSPHYLPPELSREAWLLVQAYNFRQRMPIGISSLRADSFSATFESPDAVCASMDRRIGRWRRRF